MVTCQLKQGLYLRQLLFVLDQEVRAE
jgi:hypothetical protein